MLTTKKTRSLIIYLLILFSSFISVHSRSVDKQTVLAALTLNIARFTSWPEHSFINHENTLNLCVFGGNLIQQAFKNIDNKVINNKTIDIINVSRLRNLTRCQLLYLSELDQNKLLPLLLELKGQPILTVGEDISFLQSGGMIGLEQINGKMQLNVNLPLIKPSKLVISSRLLKLSNIVNFPLSTH